MVAVTEYEARPWPWPCSFACPPGPPMQVPVSQYRNGGAGYLASDTPLPDANGTFCGE